MTRVAVVGGGVSGLAAAHELLAASGGDGVHVTLYEQEEWLGGQARTVAVDDGAGRVQHLDLGFMAFNQVCAYSYACPMHGTSISTWIIRVLVCEDHHATTSAVSRFRLHG